MKTAKSQSVDCRVLLNELQRVEKRWRQPNKAIHEAVKALPKTLRSEPERSLRQELVAAAQAVREVAAEITRLLKSKANTKRSN